MGMEMEWKEQLSVGNEMIDSDHKKLIGMVSSVERAMRAEDSFALVQALKLLWVYMDVHFANEEKIARAVKFSFDEHRLTHHYLQKEFQHLRDELEDNNIWCESAIEHFTCFLRRLLIDHIYKEDILMKPVLQTYPYDFKPGSMGGLERPSGLGGDSPHAGSGIISRST